MPIRILPPVLANQIPVGEEVVALPFFGFNTQGDGSDGGRVRLRKRG